MATLKILHITTFQRGGSGIAAMRLHKALLQQGCDSKFIFLSKGSNSETEVGYQKKIYLFDLLLRILKKLGLPLNLEQKNDYSIRKYKYKAELISFANTPYKKFHRHPWITEADIIHLHFLSDFIDFKTFFENVQKPMVWTLHDMNPFQGGFHYKGDEDLYRDAVYKIDTEQFNIKKNALGKLPTEGLTVTAPSEWLLRLSEQSEMLKRFGHMYIPNCVDTSVFKIITKKKYDKASGKKLNVLFVAESLHNQRKGFDLALEMLKDKSVLDVCHFTAVGYVKDSSRLPFISYTGIISSEAEMSRIYNKADIFLLPSREDNLPNSMVESLCCGIPVVGFAIGGLTETVINGENGYLSGEVSSEGLKEALLTCVQNIETLNPETIEREAHKKFSGEVVMSQFLDLYNRCYNQYNQKQPQLKESALTSVGR